MKKTKSLYAGAALALLAAGGAWYGAGQPGLLQFATAAEASAPPAAMPAPEVGVVRAAIREVSEFDEFTGRFEAVDEVAVRARVSGQLTAVHFEPGQIVEKGDLLFTIDPRPFETVLAEAEARLAEARAALKLANVELERQSKLSDRGHASRSSLDSAQQAAAAAKAAITGAEAAVERARLDLEFSRIHAPVSGRISDDAVNAGNLISAGAAGPALTTIVSIDPIHFVFDATEQQLLNYQRSAADGDIRAFLNAAPVAVSLNGETDFGHTGKVDFIDNRIDSATGTIRGRAVLENETGALVPGMFGRLRLTTASGVPRVFIPERAIGSDQAEKFVWVVDAGGTVSRRAITLGERRSGLRSVTGIEADELVVVDGLHMVGPGATVTARVAELEELQVASR